MELLIAFGIVVIMGIIFAVAAHIAVCQGWNIIAVWAILTIAFSVIFIFLAML